MREPIVITAAQLAQIKDLYTRDTGLEVTEADQRALLDREIREELLYREALAHGLHLHDRSIRWRLVSKMRFLNASDSAGPDEPGDTTEDAADDEADSDEGGDPEDLYREALELGLDRDDVVVKRILIHKMRLLIRLQADDDIPDEETLRAFYQEIGDDYMQPQRATFTHVFTSRDRRGDRAEPDARDVLADLAAGPTPPADAVKSGDAFPLGHTYRSRSRTGVAKIFGDGFADAVLAAEPGRWSGPFESAYGWHLVWVDEKQGERVPEFSTVRSQVFQRYVNEKRTAHLEKTLEELREEYRIVIEPGDAAADTARGNG
ncbi:MAG: peptidyl-prolyl cis-trans isomerase [Myxococcales bacterium]|nr:MAG: peptidyl-prolyl cis-trans isomerase [Myxococcales bacterium]